MPTPGVQHRIPIEQSLWRGKELLAQAYTNLVKFIILSTDRSIRTLFNVYECAFLATSRAADSEPKNHQGRLCRLTPEVFGARTRPRRPPVSSMNQRKTDTCRSDGELWTRAAGDRR